MAYTNGIQTKTFRHKNTDNISSASAANNFVGEYFSKKVD